MPANIDEMLIISSPRLWLDERDGPVLPIIRLTDYEGQAGAYEEYKGHGVCVPAGLQASWIMEGAFALEREFDVAPFISRHMMHAVLQAILPLFHQGEISQRALLSQGDNCQIRAPYYHEVLSFYGCNLHYKAVVVNGDVIAMGSAFALNGRNWAVLDLKDGARVRGFRIVRAVLRELRALDRDIYVQCKTKEAERLLRFLGFQPTGEISNEKEVWLWQKWPI